MPQGRVNLCQWVSFWGVAPDFSLEFYYLSGEKFVGEK